MNATTGMTIPLVAATGVRQTVNANISSAQTTWNLRSALNVAALNCLDPEYTGLVDNYGAFLKRNDKQLSAVNKVLTTEFRERYGATFRDVQDSYMTQVYNYFALPPTKSDFCDVSYAISNEALQVVPDDLDTFAATALPRIESVFEDFFRAYEEYRVDLAAWNSEYGPPPVIYSGQGFPSLTGPSMGVATGATTGIATDPTVGGALGTTVGGAPVATVGGAPEMTVGGAPEATVVGTPETTVVASTPPAQPVVTTGESPIVIDLPSDDTRTPIVIATEETDTQGEPIITLPTEGPVFQSGEVVQGNLSPPAEAEDTLDPQS